MQKQDFVKKGSGKKTQMKLDNLLDDEALVGDQDKAVLNSNNDQDYLMCRLCERNRPIFLTDDDKMIMRQPESSLVPFLKSLKNDYLNNRQYLKFLKINSNFIQFCQCSDWMVHSYCGTAFVLRRQQIYCKQCLGYYHLFVQSDRIFSAQYLNSILHLFVYFVIIGGITYGLWCLDLFLKWNYIKENQILDDGKIDYINNIDVDDVANILKSKIDFNKTFQSQFTIIENEYSTQLIPIFIAIGVMMIWCFYLRFSIANIIRNKARWVEVLDSQNPSYRITRKEAKANLFEINNLTNRQKLYDSMFDRIWYIKRENQYAEGIYDELNSLELADKSMQL